MKNSNENEIEKLEHENDLQMKKIEAFGWDGTNAQVLAVTNDGSLKVNFALVIE